MVLVTAHLVAAVGPAGLHARLDRSEASLQDPITLTVTVEGSARATPTLPDLSAFEVHPSGRATKMQVVNGHMSSSVVYSYTLVARRPGHHRLGPVSVEVEGVGEELLTVGASWLGDGSVRLAPYSAVAVLRR